MSIDSTNAFETARQYLYVQFEEAGARLTNEALPVVTADESQLVQVFQNLIGNALKYRRDVQPQIHVSAMQNAGEWVFAVTDNGIGIDPQFKDRIFVMFQRLHGGADYPGTGVGLAISKKIVERHGGPEPVNDFETPTVSIY